MSRREDVVRRIEQAFEDATMPTTELDRVLHVPGVETISYTLEVELLRCGELSQHPAHLIRAIE